MKTRTVSDDTPPPPAVEVKAERTEAGVALTWSVLADLESGARPRYRIVVVNGAGLRSEPSAESAP